MVMEMISLPRKSKRPSTRLSSLCSTDMGLSRCLAMQMHAEAVSWPHSPLCLTCPSLVGAF